MNSRHHSSHLPQLAFIAAVLLFVMSGLAHAQPLPVSGTVVARDTGRAIPDARVTIDGSGLTAVTNVVGRFRIDGAQPGVVVLIVRAPGYFELRVPNIEAGMRSATEIVAELDPTPNVFEAVQVTASKTPMAIGDLAGQANVIDRRTIDRRNDQVLSQAVNNVPGAIVSGQAGSFESVLLRGMPRDGNEFTTTLLMVDGVPQVDSRNSARIVSLPIFDAASIEVTRGPNSALHGRTAIGGVVNMRTADPTPDQQWDFQFARGEFATARGIARVSGPVTDRIGYYVSAGIDRNEGFYVNDDNTFEITEGAFFGKMTFVPDDVSFASLSYHHVASEHSLPTNVPVIDGVLLSDLDTAYDRLSNINIPGTNYKEGQNRFIANYTRELNARTQLTGVFGYHGYRYEFIQDGDVIGGPFDLEAQTLTMYPFEQLTEEDVFYQEGRVEFRPSIGELRSSLLAGVSYEHTGGTNAGNLIYTDPETGGWPLDYLDPTIPATSTWQRDSFGGREYDLGVTGLFFQYTAEPSRWILTAGGRYDHMSIENTATQLEDDPVTEHSFSAFSPKVSALYKLIDPGDDVRPALSVYGLYSAAFQPPRRPSDLVPTDFVVDLEPENIDNYEFGAKGRINEQLLFSAGYFYMTRKGVVANLRQGPYIVPTNSGEHIYKGFEAEAAYDATDRLWLYANTAFYANRFGDFVIESLDDDDQTVQTVLTGNHLPVSPDYIVSWGGLYRFRPDLNFTLNVKHVGDSQMDIYNTFTLDGYTSVDVAGEWRWKVLRINLSARNLFDSEFYWGGDTSLAESADPGHPRQVLLTIGALFR